MAGNRTYKLSILADVDNLRKGLNQADNDIQGFSGKIEGFAKTAGLAFAAAGAAAVAYAGKLAIDGVKAAIEDEAAQAKLATTLKNVTNATNNQVAAVEDYILKTSLAFGVTDDELRPSLDRLIRSVKDVTEAQKLQTLAINISAGSGKSLQAVSEALAKAHDGNFGALKRLGVSIDENIIKTKDFDAATATLSETFANQATIQADTFDGKMRRLRISFDEAKETVGSFILDAIQPMIDSIVKYVVPAVLALTNSIGGSEGLKSVFNDFMDGAKRLFIPIFQGLKSAFDSIKDAVKDNKEEFTALFNFLKNFVAPFVGGALKIAIEALGDALSLIIRALGTVINLIDRAFNALKRFVDFIKNNPITNFFTGASFNTGIGGGSTVTNAGFNTIPSVPNAPATLETFRERGGFQGNITVNGAISPIATARQIAQILGIEATTSGTFTNLGESFV